MKKYHRVEISFKCYNKLSTEENHWEKSSLQNIAMAFPGNMDKNVRISLVLFILRLDLR